MKRGLPFAFVLLLACALPAQAGGSGLIHAQQPQEGRSGDFQIEYDDQGHARVSGGQAPGYLLVRDGRAYSVTGEGQVYDLAQVAAVLKSMPRMGLRRGGAAGGMGGERFGGRGPQLAADMLEFQRITPTGRNETVANLVGEVYRLEYRGLDGSNKQSELVLGRQPPVRDFTQALYKLGLAVQANLGRPPAAGGRAFFDYLSQHGLGLLRMDQTLRMQRLLAAPPPAERFVLPNPPTPVNGIRDLVGLRDLRPPR